MQLRKATLKQKIKLSDEFLSQYKGKNPKWGFDGLGYIVYLRTYARTKVDGTLEQWWETVRRFTEGNFLIEAERLHELGKLTPERLQILKDEMERFYHLAFNLIILPPGRGIWMSGTEYAEKRSMDALNNCWLVACRPQAYGDSKIQPDGDKRALKPSFPAVFTFDQAMKGGGVGVNIQRKNTDKMPEVSNSLQLSFYCDESHPDYKNKLKKLDVNSGVYYVESYLVYADKVDDTFLFKIPDSREGWALALQKVIDAHFEGKERLLLDVSEIRAEGEPIKGFGGVASGPAPLVKMLTSVNDILNKARRRKLTPVEWGDIIQLIGTCVVAGNVRRTALILIGDQDDRTFIESKNYDKPENKAASQWRWASNNSVDITPYTNRFVLHQLAENVYYNGEPGIVNIFLSKHYGRIIDGIEENIDGEVEGFNPCGEISLPNASPCNLFEVNLPGVERLIQSGKESNSLYEEVFYLAARYAYRVTFREYEWEATRKVVERHRRIGVSITGITDWVLMKTGNRAINNPVIKKELDLFYKYVKESNLAQAKELEAPPSIKVTTVKPSGTLSLLMGVSAGMHYHWSKYMIRRVRLATNAPLVPVLKQAGYHVEQAIKGFKEDGSYVYDDTTVVVSFPVKAPTADYDQFQSSNEVSLEEQAALQALLARYWADNSVSATLTFNKPEPKPVYFQDGTMLLDKFGYPKLEVDPREEKQVIESITNVLDQYKTTIKSMSLLPHDNNSYPQMPLEEISKEQYEEMVSNIKTNIWDLTGNHVEADTESDDDIIGECQGGSCPIK